MISFARFSCVLLLVAVTKAAEECPQLRPATGLEMNQVLGTWYAVRGLEHAGTNSSSPKQTKACPVIKILTKGEDEIEFQWNSKDKPQKKIDLTISKARPGFLEYTKKGTKNSFRSLQISTDGNKRNVIAVTMCKSGGRVASVVLNREAKYTEGEVKALTNLLASQGLNVNNVYDRCIKD